MYSHPYGLWLHPWLCQVGGGEGMGAIEAQVNALARQIGAGAQLVVVCGRNQKLVNKYVHWIANICFRNGSNEPFENNGDRKCQTTYI